MGRSTRFDDVLGAAYVRGMTADALLHRLSVEGGLTGARVHAFRRLRTEERLQRIRAYLRARLFSGSVALPFMRQALLDSLRGLPLEEAKRAVIAEGHGFEVYPYGVASIMIAKPNLVKLWLSADGLTVLGASAGDGLELDTRGN